METITVHNLIIVDASGSMESNYNQALSGINETLATIRSDAKKNDGICQRVTLLSFASGGDPLAYIYCDAISSATGTVSPRDYKLRGCTALYDAIGNSASGLEHRMGKDEKALVTIITDGQENDSRTWSRESIKKLIDRLTAQGWAFSYIGANQDTAFEAERIGVVNNLSFEATVEGTQMMFERERHARMNWYERARRHEAELERRFFEKEEARQLEIPQNRITPSRIDRLADGCVFVFGSNVRGFHSGGAARAAVKMFGARIGVGEGPQGRSYAIPTVGCSPYETEMACRRFIHFARQHSEKHFLVTRIGCGNGGWREDEMARLLADARYVDNISLPVEFWRHIAQ